MTIMMEIYINGENGHTIESMRDDCNINSVELELNKPLLEQIIRLRDVAVKHSLLDVVVESYAPTWGEVEVDEITMVADCGELHVSRDNYWFTAYVKHTVVELITERLPVSACIHELHKEKRV